MKQIGMILAEQIQKEFRSAHKNLHLQIDFPASDCYIELIQSFSSGRSVAWLARLVRDQEVGSSNLPAPTMFSAYIFKVRRRDDIISVRPKILRID